jgi:tetraprenyl-beta-curcumene synthase
MARAGSALVLANLRYWSTVAPLVRAQLSRWEQRARAISNPFLRTLALDKLRQERFNIEAAATLATLAPRGRHEPTVQAIVALQVMYDYLDLLTEQPLTDPLGDGRGLYEGFIEAVAPRARARGGSQPVGESQIDLPNSHDGGYLEELTATVRLALAQLPATAAIAEVAQHSARRCARAQVLGHAAIRSGTAELERWARREATGTDLQWPEYLAGAAASVLAVHALIAAAADERTTRQDAEEIDAVYLSIGALTMLDSLVDREHDVATGELDYSRCYDSHEQMALRLVSVARDTASGARSLPNAAHHIMTLVGIVAYYSSAPAAGSAFALPVTAHMRRELQPLIAPTLAIMRAWRLAKRVRRRFDGRSLEICDVSSH